jgi:hypothetical protein
VLLRVAVSATGRGSLAASLAVYSREERCSTVSSGAAEIWSIPASAILRGVYPWTQ